MMAMEVALTGRPNALNQAQSRKDSLSREQGWMRRGLKEKANNSRTPKLSEVPSRTELPLVSRMVHSSLTGKGEHTHLAD